MEMSRPDRVAGLVPLAERQVQKPWGRKALPPQFLVPASAGAIGEIWYELGEPSQVDDLLIKFLFTSDRLSVQVHPDDKDARRAGYRCGKDEAWLVVEAEPEARIAAGLTGVRTTAEIESAILDGSIESLLKWHPVKPGDAFYSPAGMIHAIGAGLVLLEVQQNVDLTYRLYDYGRPRELQIKAGLEALKPESSLVAQRERRISPGRSLIVAGPKFSIEKWTWPLEGCLSADADHPVWAIPWKGTCALEDRELRAPSVWLARQPVRFSIPQGAELLIAYGQMTSPLLPADRSDEISK